VGQRRWIIHGCTLFLKHNKMKTIVNFIVVVGSTLTLIGAIAIAIYGFYIIISNLISIL